ncbi:MAG: DUF456 domain-containing protein [Actinobacteria bacterium]|nr:DUF456 domain-containing protein [Actinomycetota bacterium]
MEAPSNPLLWITLVTMLVGLAGSVLPGLPGVPLIFLSALVYSFLTDFEHVGGLVIALLGLFAAIALVADFVATTYGARRFGASNWGTAGGAIGGIVGALVGALFLGIGALFGLILGSIGGVFLGEYLRRRERETSGEPSLAQAERWDWRRASRAAGGVFVGYVVSAITQGFLGLLSVVVFVWALFN